MAKKKRFKALEQKDVREAYQFQNKKTDWTFYNERAFIENLFSERFNYLLIVYSLIVTAFSTVQDKNNKLIILCLGFIVTSLISLTIYRIYIKLDITLKILHSLEKNHVFPIIQKETKAKGWKAFKNVNPLIGIIIPCFFVLSFIIGIILISTDIWEFSKHCP